jgi:hypothetical protein
MGAGHYVRRLLELAFLAPDITEAILEGRQPRDMMLEEIMRNGLPISWVLQRRILHIS